MSDKSVSVKFTAEGSGLSSFFDNIKKKSDELTQSAIQGAMVQSTQAKEQLRLIGEQILALEKKNKIEVQQKRGGLIGQNSAYIDELERKRKADLLWLGKKKGTEFYSDDWVKSREDNVNNNTDALVKKSKGELSDGLKSIREEEKDRKAAIALAKENINTLKETASKNIKAITAGDAKLVDVVSAGNTSEEKLVSRLTEDGVNQNKKKEDREKSGTGGGLLGSLLNVESINRMLSGAAQFSQSQNGFDMIAPAKSMMGTMIGSVLGAVVGSIVPGIGTAFGAGAGGAIGTGIGSLLGGVDSREAMTGQEYLKAKYRYNAITGSSGNSDHYISNLQESGISAIQFSQMESEYARRRGNRESSASTTRDAIYSERGYGVEQGTSAGLIEMQRSAREGNKNLAELIGGVIQKGQGSIFKNGDNTFLNEFLGKFSTLQRELLKTQTNVASGTTMDVLQRFNKLGGEWDVQDPRSMANISAIQSGLTNPGSDNLKALSFGVLRQQMPNASIIDLLSERQKGLGSPAYLKGMLGQVDRMGGDDSQKQMNISGMFPGLSLSAVRKLYQNKDALLNGRTSMEELKAKYTDDFQTKSDGNTAPIDKISAGLTNKVLLGEITSGMVDAFTKAINATFSGAVIEIQDGNKLRLKSAGTVIKENTTRQAKKEESSKTFSAIMDASGGF